MFGGTAFHGQVFLLRYSAAGRPDVDNLFLRFLWHLGRSNPDGVNIATDMEAGMMGDDADSDLRLLHLQQQWLACHAYKAGLRIRP